MSAAIAAIFSSHAQEYQAVSAQAEDVPNWLTCCEILPEHRPFRGWVEAMTSLGRLIFFDQPGTCCSVAGEDAVDETPFGRYRLVELWSRRGRLRGEQGRPDQLSDADQADLVATASCFGLRRNKSR